MQSNDIDQLKRKVASLDNYMRAMFEPVVAFEADKVGTTTQSIGAGWNIISFANEVYDTEGAYNAGTSGFTAPHRGWYFILGRFHTTTAGSRLLASIYVNGAERVRGTDSAHSFSPGEAPLVSAILPLEQGDTVKIYAFASGGMNLSNGNAHFIGYMLRRRYEAAIS